MRGRSGFVLKIKGVFGKSEPEIEQVAHDVEGINVTLQPLEESQHPDIIDVGLCHKMGISQKNSSHASDSAVTRR